MSIIQNMGNKSNGHGNCLHYRDYVGSLELSERDGVFHGKVIGVKALISFEGDSVNSIIEDFHNAVDEYLKFCADNGIKATPALSVSLLPHARLWNACATGYADV